MISKSKQAKSNFELMLPPPPPKLAQSSVSTGVKQLSKLKRFLTTLQQFALDISPEIGDIVRNLVLNLVNSTITVEEFHKKLQETTNFPLRPFVIPFLRSTMPLLQQELLYFSHLSKANNDDFVIKTFENNLFNQNEDNSTKLTFKQSTSNNSGLHSTHFKSDFDMSKFQSNQKRKSSEEHSLFSESSHIDMEKSDETSYHKTREKKQCTSSNTPMLGLANSIQSLSGTDVFGGLPNQFFFPGLSAPSPVETYNPAINSLNSAFSMKNQWLMMNKFNANEQNQFQALNNSPNQSNCIKNDKHPNTNAERINTPINYINSINKENTEDDDYLKIENTFNSIIDMVNKSKIYLNSLNNKAKRIRTERPNMTTQKYDENEIKKRIDEAVQKARKEMYFELKSNIEQREKKANETLQAERENFHKLIIELNKQDENDLENCWNCGRRGFQTCSNCGQAKYCTQFCQKKHWTNVHHKRCKENNKKQELAEEDLISIEKEIEEEMNSEEMNRSDKNNNLNEKKCLNKNLTSPIEIIDNDNQHQEEEINVQE